MDIQNLIRMANRVAEFFAGMPDAAEAAQSVAMHLQKYWEPRMRRQLLAHVAGQGDGGLHPLLAQALRAHGEQLKPAEASRSTGRP
jgi:formate dehydrogenase subunit delta